MRSAIARRQTAESRGTAVGREFEMAGEISVNKVHLYGLPEIEGPEESEDRVLYAIQVQGKIEQGTQSGVTIPPHKSPKGPK